MEYRFCATKRFFLNEYSKILHFFLYEYKKMYREKISCGIGGTKVAIQK